MAANPDITVEVNSLSLPGRQVYFIIKFINHDDQDYYYLTDYISGPYGWFSVNNTVAAKEYNVLWDGCGPAEPYALHTGSGAVHFSILPANGERELKMDIVAICSFLREEPSIDNTEGYWFRYEHHGSMGFMGKPCEFMECFADAIPLPKTELHFDLLD